ncbi:MAG TPA: tRNA preQ1(34) S-adenosylmethionine ribosyltransferase-isomerase QueA [Candidatus Anaerofilum excrementigallinarum]|nr:tRNA preQ1(34) S-adenosylmethionine ribosyltransferase-isomerase QueA [Candidatus Anaerofilum excrementigallinarum]
MLKHDFWYDLPKELIAQEPCLPRDAARLLCLGRQDGSIRHQIFNQLPSLLYPGDLLVVNNSKVLPARLIGHKAETGAVCELLLLREERKDEWECLARPGKKLKPGIQVIFGDGTLVATILETRADGNKLVRFSYDTDTLYEKLDAFGKMPLPPYITKQLEDGSQYQTVYAKELGSAAAPTAGLHFTPELMDQLREKGIEFAEVTLHVGLGTFRPVKEEKVEDHEMHTEWYSISQETADAIRRTKERGGRVIAVGTTSCRTLEAAAGAHDGEICACSGDTNIFIYPGYTFRCIDGLITNFHLPESTLIMLVSAFCGYENTMHAYQVAVQEKYRFFSFGDAMLIL